MATSPTATSAPSAHPNNFNFLRLMLATLVLLSHSFELVDGDRHRELMTRVFHSVSLGEVAVDGFFLLSGLLIVASWQRQPRVGPFFRKRALRIYPGFVVASLLCALLVGPLGAGALGAGAIGADAGYFARVNWPSFGVGLVLLRPPNVGPVFVGQPYPLLNGAMWTIQYEFGCYLLVALMGMGGVVKRRNLWLIFALAMLCLWVLLGHANLSSRDYLTLGRWQFEFGTLFNAVRFVAFFACGGCFALFQDRVRYGGKWALIAAILLISSLFRPDTAQLGLATLGAYTLLWFGFAPIPLLARFRTFPDWSYGCYLYGWPLQKLLRWFAPSLAPGWLFLLACGASYACGALSWKWVERPFLQLKR